MQIGDPYHGSSLSIPQWQGSKPNRFKGGRRHDNHPRDQLDHFLLGSPSSLFEDLGKKHYQHKPSLQGKPVSYPQMRTYQQHYQKSRMFQIENMKKLINLNAYQVAHQHTFTKSIKPMNTIGHSKMKQLQKGNKQSGIYRNFYKSQVKSTIGAGGEKSLRHNQSIKINI